MRKNRPESPEGSEAKDEELIELFPVKQGFFSNQINLIQELNQRKKKILKKVREASPSTSPQKEKDQVMQYISKIYDKKASKLLREGIGTTTVPPMTIEEEKANESELTVITQSPYAPEGEY